MEIKEGGNVEGKAISRVIRCTDLPKRSYRIYCTYSSRRSAFWLLSNMRNNCKNPNNPSTDRLIASIADNPQALRSVFLRKHLQRGIIGDTLASHLATQSCAASQQSEGGFAA